MKTSKAVISTEEQQVACEEECWGFRASLSFRRKRQGQAGGEEKEREGWEGSSGPEFLPLHPELELQVPTDSDPQAYPKNSRAQDFSDKPSKQDFW